MASVLAERRPEPVERQAPGEDPSSRTVPPPVVRQPARLAQADIEHLLQARESSHGFVDDPATSLRGRRARAAYAALQYSDQRDYATRVLGIDEYA